MTSNRHHPESFQLLNQQHLGLIGGRIIVNNNNDQSIYNSNHYDHQNHLTYGNSNSNYNNNNNNLSRQKLRQQQRLQLHFEKQYQHQFRAKQKQLQQTLEQSLPVSRTVRRQSLLDIGFGQLSTYAKLNKLGAGTYSIVYKGTSKLTNKLVALKEIHLERDEGVPFTAIREVSLLKELKHNNIITLHDIILTSRTLTLVFEYVDKDLSCYMSDCDFKIQPKNIKLFLFQLLRALKYCHSRRILHRDLKPQNILISSIGELRLADFGLARAKSFPTKTFTDEVVTLWYRPPDVLLGNVEYDTSIDMWGVGCIFFEMDSGHTLFTGPNPAKQIERIFEIIGTPDCQKWPGIKSDLESRSLSHLPHYPGRDLSTLAPRLDLNGIDLLSQLLQCNPDSRISTGESMSHKYFDSLPKEIHLLSDSKSIFSIPSIRLAKEHCNSQSKLNFHQQS